MRHQRREAKPDGTDAPGTPGLRGLAERWAEHPAAAAVLAASVLAEATFFPAPTEAVLLALALARPARIPALVAGATAAAVLASALGYGLGAELYEPFVLPLVGALGLERELLRVGDLFRDRTFMALASSGFTPVPYLVYTLAGGALGAPLIPFLSGAAVGRGAKYALLALLARLLGPAVWEAVERWGPWVLGLAGAALLLLVLLW